jgi:hypothetical protein
MKTKPMLGDWEIPRIESMRTLERRSFAEFAIPGRVGSLYQDLNTVPTHVAISGSLYGDEASNKFLQDVHSKFNDGTPVTFVADIITATQVKYVILETLRFEQSGTKPDQLDYFIVLKESPPPPPPPDPLGGLDTSLLDQAGNFLDTVTGALDVVDSAGSIPNISDPTAPLNDVLNSLTTAMGGLGDALGPLQGILGA